MCCELCDCKNTMLLSSSVYFLSFKTHISILESFDLAFVVSCAFDIQPEGSSSVGLPRVVNSDMLAEDRNSRTDSHSGASYESLLCCGGTNLCGKWLLNHRLSKAPWLIQRKRTKANKTGWLPGDRTRQQNAPIRPISGKLHVCMLRTSWMCSPSFVISLST